MLETSINTGRKYVSTLTLSTASSTRSVTTISFTTIPTSPDPSWGPTCHFSVSSRSLWQCRQPRSNRTLGWGQSRHGGELHQLCHVGSSIATWWMHSSPDSRGEGECKNIGCRASMSQMEWWVPYGRWDQVCVILVAGPSWRHLVWQESELLVGLPGTY